MTDFAADLRAWLVRNDITEYRAAKLFGAKSPVTVARWLTGAPATYEPCIRARMREIDEGRG